MHVRLTEDGAPDYAPASRTTRSLATTPQEELVVTHYSDVPPHIGSPRMTVIGTGYLGATHAVCMAVLGFEVLGVDVDPAKIDALASGRVPFFEPGLPEKLP